MINREFPFNQPIHPEDNESINRVFDRNYGNKLKSGDTTTLKYTIKDGDGEPLDKDNLIAMEKKAILKYDNLVAYETFFNAEIEGQQSNYDGDLVARFKIEEVLPPSDKPYIVEFHFEEAAGGERYIFPSNNTLELFITPSSLNADDEAIVQVSEQKLDEAVAKKLESNIILKDAEEQELQRRAAEAERQANYDELVETGIMQENINEKLADSERTYAPRLTNLEQNDAELTAQLAQNAIDPEFKSTSRTEEIQLGEELLNGADWVSTGWTGSEEVGFTHQTGNEYPLTKSFTGEGITNIYLVEFTATNTGQAEGGTSDFFVTLGNSYPFETYKGTFSSEVYSFGIKTNQPVNELKIIPRVGYTGTISNISVREVILYTTPTLSILDSETNRTLEMRTGKDKLKNLFVGENSGRTNISGEQNTAFGDRSLGNLTTGFWNVAQGFETLRDNTVGTRNVALGRIALRENISGDRNVGIGSFALTRNKTGRANIGIGADAGYFIESGNFNVAIGLVALGANIDGDNNVAIGERTMAQSKHGSDSIGIGKYALTYNEGKGNIGLGELAGYHMRTGNNNFIVGDRAVMFNRESDDIIAIGAQALHFSQRHSNIAMGNRSQHLNETGIHNVSMGKNTLHDNVIGSHNIALGFEAGKTLKKDYNIAIGGSSLSQSDTGEENTGIGFQALNKAKGRRNVSVGINAGFGLENGDFNVFIGGTSGSNANNGSNNILIGYNTQKLSSQLNDQLNIGNIIKSRDMTSGLLEVPKLRLTDLPTSQPTEAGVLWNDNGTLKIV